LFHSINCSFEVQPVFVSLNEPLGAVTQARMVCALAVVAKTVIRAPATIPIVADRFKVPEQVLVFIMPEAVQCWRQAEGPANSSEKPNFRLATHYSPCTVRTNSWAGSALRSAPRRDITPPRSNNR
jgi:hypothetical protein